MYEFKKNNLFFVTIGLLLVLIDQIAKYKIRTSGGFYICNRNLAFSIPALNFFLILLSIAAIFLAFNLKSISNFKFQISDYGTLVSFSSLLILSGAVSNILDRIIFGCVIDFIDLRIWPVFNLADIYITIGAIIIITNIFRTTYSH